MKKRILLPLAALLCLVLLAGCKMVTQTNIDGWKFAELPEGPTEAGSFTLWQVEALTVFVGEKEAKINEIGTVQIYGDGDCLTIETMLTDIIHRI